MYMGFKAQAKVMSHTVTPSIWQINLHSKKRHTLAKNDFINLKKKSHIFARIRNYCANVKIV